MRDLIDKAEKFMASAEHALNIGDYDSCVSRSLLYDVLYSRGGAPRQEPQRLFLQGSNKSVFRHALQAESGNCPISGEIKKLPVKF